MGRSSHRSRCLGRDLGCRSSRVFRHAASGPAGHRSCVRLGYLPRQCRGDRLGGEPRAAVGDLARPWRAQVYADLEAHLLLVVWWIYRRERSPPIGTLYGAATVLLGGLFTIPYILIATIRAKGDPQGLLLATPGKSPDHRPGSSVRM
jgi:hypothetical protein